MTDKSTSMPSDTTDVVIVGAGPVGLATAIELGRRGVRCVVIERNDRVGYSPRAKTTNVRTREHLRRWGIADTLRAASPISPDRPATVIFATRMNGPLLARFEDAMNGTRLRNNLYSEEAQWVPQYVLEEVLRQHADTLATVSFRFQTEFRALKQSVDHAEVTVADLSTGQQQTLRSAYVIGADGPRSRLREAIGAKLVGDGALAKNYSIIFRAPELNARQIHGDGIIYLMVNNDVPAMLGPLDEVGLWSFMAAKLADNVDPTTLDAVDLVRRGTGFADLPVEIVGIDVWAASRLVADRYRRGRVLLAGDACHLHPPFGGFGMNMGIGDAVDVGWKLAARLQGWGGEVLLDSYEHERRPVHERTIAEAMANYGAAPNQMVRAGLEDAGIIGETTRREVGDIILATKVREFRTLGVVLGMRYKDSNVIVPDGSAPPPEHFTLYTPSAHPGCLAPHLWLADGSSLYDHFGDGFTLLITSGAMSDASPLAAAAAARGVPLTVAVPGDARLRARYEARFALIRPDQHVAWRGDVLPLDPDALLVRVTGSAPQL